MKNAAIFSVKKEVHLLSLMPKLPCLKFWWNGKTLKDLEGFQAVLKPRWGCREGCREVLARSRQREGKCQIAWVEILSGAFTKRTMGPEDWELIRVGPEDINIKSLVFQNGSKEMNGLTRCLQNSLVSNWESCGQWDPQNKFQSQCDDIALGVDI